MQFDGIRALEQTDTSPRAAERQLELLRAMTPAHRLHLAGSLSEAGRQLSMRGLRRQRPDLSELELKFAFIELVYGSAIAAMCRRSARK